MTSSATALTGEALDGVLNEVAEGARRFVVRRRSPAGSFAFSLAEHAYAAEELNALTTGLELWKLLGMPLDAADRADAIAALRRYQHPETGLVVDPSWRDRARTPGDPRWTMGDSFFTMTTSRALAALGSTLSHPVRYVVELSAAAIEERLPPEAGCHLPYSIGDLAPLVHSHVRLGIAGAETQWSAILELVGRLQDPSTGLWPRGSVELPLTPSINRTFHYLRSSWNLAETPYQGQAEMIDSCLSAASNPEFYSLETGYACNDLDLALVLYSARTQTAHRAAEVGEWARATLPDILSVQKPDGGFSFYRQTSMTQHAGVAMSDGQAEGDLWGTLMYLGTVKMMVELGYAGKSAPWEFSAVHAVPGTGLRAAAEPRKPGRSPALPPSSGAVATR